MHRFGGPARADRWSCTSESITSLIRVAWTSICLSNARRRSPSVNTPSTRSSLSTTTVMPNPFLDISSRPSRSFASGNVRGTASPVRIMSSTCSRSCRPRAPPGCERAKSCFVKPRASRTVTANASPIASVAVVLAVGARFNGQASSATLTSSVTFAARPRVESVLPTRTMSGTASRFRCGSSRTSSGVSPEFDRASTTSVRVIIPRSPWLASAGWRKKAGVPVLARVAAILPAMWPDLPIRSPRSVLRSRGTGDRRPQNGRRPATAGLR